MKWFGASWGAPICDPAEHIETPDGEVCPGCTRTIRPESQGVQLPWVRDDGFVDRLDWHLECFTKVLGLTSATGPRPPR